MQLRSIALLLVLFVSGASTVQAEFKNNNGNSKGNGMNRGNNRHGDKHTRGDVSTGPTDTDTHPAQLESRTIDGDCVLEIYGTEPNHAAGEPSLRLLDSAVLVATNAVADNIFSDNKPEDAKAIPVQAMVTSTVLVPETHVEDEEIIIPGSRNLRRNKDGRRLTIGFLYNFMHVGYVCRFCYKDNSDRRRTLQEGVDAEVDLDGLVVGAADIIKNDIRTDAFYKDVSCVKYTCDFSDTVDESAGCESI